MEKAGRGAVRGVAVSDAFRGPQGTGVLAAALFRLWVGHTVACPHSLPQALPAAQHRG